MRKFVLLSLFVAVSLSSLLLGGADACAQGDTAAQWNVFSIPVPSDSFYSRFRPSPTGPPFFLDSLRGYCRWQPNTVGDTSGAGWYFTGDGGKTWERYYRMPPIPHRMEGLFGVASDGSMTTDGGGTWRSFFADSSVSISRLVQGGFSAQGLPRVMAALVGKSPARLVFSTNGGATWVYADTLITRRDRINPAQTVTVLSDTTLFGVIPTDSATGKFQWVHLLGMEGDTLYATTRTLPVQEPAAPLSEFWAIDLKTRTARHHTVDTLHRLALNYLQRSDAGLLYAWNYPNGSQSYFVRSTNEGRNWNVVAGYNWLDFTYFRFLSPTYGISSNGVTTDGGKTWKQWGSKWEITSFFAADSLHLFATTSRQFLRSTDAGRSWEPSGNLWWLDGTDALYAWKKRMVVGAGAGNVLVSSDSAEHWVHLADTPGALPAEFSRLRAVAAPDAEGDPERVVALASCFSVDSSAYYACMMASTNGGTTWQEIARFPEFDSVIQGAWSMQFVQNSGGTGTTGFLQGGNPSVLYRTTDGGVSWRFVTEEPLQALAMADDQYGVAGREGALLRTTDGGLLWTVTKTYTAPLRFTYGLTAFDRDHYAGILPNNLQQPYEWRPIHSNDGAATWALLRGLTYQVNDPGYLHWRSPREVYSISELGLLYSSDSGKRFSTLRTVLRGNTSIVSDGSYIYQFSSDSARVGRWRIQDFASSVEERNATETDARLTLTVVEQPVRDVLRFRYAVSGSIAVSGQLYDRWGAQVASVPPFRCAGEGVLELNVSGLPSGVYFLRFLSDGKESIPVVPVTIL